MPTASTTARSPYSRTNPFPGRMVVNRSLCGEGSRKDTRHFEIDLTGWGLSYEVGDSMTIWASNDPALVDDILKAICAKGDEPVKGPKGETTLREALLPRLPDHTNDAEVFENDRRPRERRALVEGVARSGTQGRPRSLSLGHGRDRLPGRASLDQDFAAGIRRCPREIAAAALLDCLQPEGASGFGPFHHRRGEIREPRTPAQRGLLHLSRRTRGQRAHPGFPERLEISPPG